MPDEPPHHSLHGCHRVALRARSGDSCGPWTAAITRLGRPRQQRMHVDVTNIAGYGSDEACWPIGPTRPCGRGDRMYVNVARDDPDHARGGPGGPGAQHAAPRLPRPAPAGHHRRQPEGWCRQDHQHGQPRGRAGHARAAGAGDRPRPAGQREHRAGDRAHSGTPSIYEVLVDGMRWRKRSVPVEQAPPLVRAGHHRPRRRRDRAGLRGRPRAPAAQGDRRVRPGRRLHPRRLPAVAGAAHRQRAGRRRRGAHPDPVRVLRARRARPAAEQHRADPAHLNGGLQVSTILLTMYDGRTKLADQVAQEVRSHFGDLVLDVVIPRIGPGVRGAWLWSVGDDVRPGFPRGADLPTRPPGRWPSAAPSWSRSSRRRGSE